jgi:hypothetical protein
MAIAATVLICDDMRVENTGKIILVGIYPGELSILSDPSILSQICFFVSIDMPIDEIPKAITTEITLPNQAPNVTTSEITPDIESLKKPGRRKFLFRQLVGLRNVPLSPGRIELKVRCDETEIEVATPWIVMADPTA